MKYAIIIEKAENNYSAYAPDVPGCVAAGDTFEEVKQLMQEALEFHFEALQMDSLPIPESTSQVEYVEVKVPQLS